MNNNSDAFADLLTHMSIRISLYEAMAHNRIEERLVVIANSKNAARATEIVKSDYPQYLDYYERLLLLI